MSKNCPGCNREISPDTQICPYCRKEQTRKINHKNYPIWLYLSILAIIGGVVGIFVIRNSDIASDFFVYLFLLITFIGLMGTYFSGFAVRPSSVPSEEASASIKAYEEEFKKQYQESQEREEEELRERLKEKEALRQIEQEKREIIRALKTLPHLENIAYLRGHEAVITPTSTISSLLVIQEDQLRYFSKMKELFTIPISQIRSMLYETSKKITVTTAEGLELSPSYAKAEFYFLIIEYIAQNGLSNAIVFHSSKKDDVFFNELNVARNKYASVKANDHQLSLATDEKFIFIKDLFDRELISEEEYKQKKQELLDLL